MKKLFCLVLAGWQILPAAAVEPVIYEQIPGQPVMLEADVAKLDPQGVIIRAGQYEENSGNFMVAPTVTAPEVWVERTGDWLEPITSPQANLTPQVGLTQMKLVELRGSVEVVLPGADKAIVAATEEMVLPEGATVRTAAGASVAVFMGGVNSVRLAPGTTAQVNQSLAEGKRTTLIDLQAGVAFSKVGRRAGELQDFKVKTPYGVAAAKGTDFVTVKLPERMDVWIAEGKVQLDDAEGKKVGEVSSAPGLSLQIIRIPAEPDELRTAQANSLTMGAAISLIPGFNQKVKILRTRLAQGETLAPEEAAYLKRVRTITWLVKARKI